MKPFRKPPSYNASRAAAQAAADNANALLPQMVQVLANIEQYTNIIDVLPRTTIKTPQVTEIGTTGAEGTGQQGAPLTLLPVETGPGILDLTKPLKTVAWVSGAAYETLRASVEGAIASLNTFSAAGQQVAVDLQAVVQQNIGVLADIEQYTNIIDVLPRTTIKTPQVTEIGTTGAEGTLAYSGGTYSAWASSIGVKQGFNRVQFPIFPTTAITTVRVRVKSNDVTGAVLADVTVAVTTTLNTRNLITVDFPDVIANAAGSVLFLEYFCNGLTGYYAATGSFPAGRLYFAKTSNVTATTLLQGDVGALAAEFALVNKSVFTVAPTSEWAAQLSAALANPQKILPKIASLNPAVTDLGATGTEGGLGYSGGSFSAWGSNVGPKQGFNRVSFPIFPTTAITAVRVRIKAGGYTGTLLADVTVNVTTTLNARNLITIDLPATIANAAASDLFVEYLCNGKTGYYGATGTPPAGKLYYGQSSATSNTTFTQTTDTAALYVSFAFVNSAVYTVAPTSEWTVALGNVLGNPQKLLPKMATLEPLLGTLRSEVLSAGTSAVVFNIPYNGTETANPFSSFGFPIGKPQDFDYLEFVIVPNVKTRLPTKIHVRVRQVNSAGAILADKTIAISTVWNTAKTVRVQLDALIANAAAGQLWLEYALDGYAAYQGVYSSTAPTLPDAGPYARARFGRTALPNTPSENTFPNTDFDILGFLWVKIGVASAEQQLALGGDMRAAVQEAAVQAALTNPPILSLPPILYATEGQEFNLYFENVLRLPAGRKWTDYTYEAGITGATPLHRDARRLAWTPTTAQAATASYSAFINVFLGDTLLVTGTTTIRVQPLATGSGTPRKLLALGDSITNRGVWLSEVIRLTQRAGDPLDVTSIGTRNSPTPPAGNPATMTEGWEGKTISFHYRDPTSNFTFNGADPNGTTFSFSQYLAANSLSMAAGDLWMMMLGTNDLPGNTDAGNLNTIAGMIADTNAMIANVQAAVPGINIGIATNIPMARNPYSPLRSRARVLWAETLLATYGNREGEGIYLIPVAQALDAEYGFPVEMRGTSARAAAATPTAQLPYITDVLHPNNGGYFQMGDAVYAFMKWLWRA